MEKKTEKWKLTGGRSWHYPNAARNGRAEIVVFQNRQNHGYRGSDWGIRHVNLKEDHEL